MGVGAARRLMDERPGEAIAWYAAGCYYMACCQVRSMVSIS